jgi:anti-sigma regulatory factor (Ser/Thr protein kinase)
MSVTLIEERTFPLQPSSASAARRFVDSVLEVDPPVAESLRLAVSEIATNALLHARTPFRVRVSRNSVIRVEVQDSSSVRPMRREISAAEVSGRGLAIVDQLADRWGVAESVEGKCVWFEVDIARAADAAQDRGVDRDAHG